MGRINSTSSDHETLFSSGVKIRTSGCSEKETRLELLLIDIGDASSVTTVGTDRSWNGSGSINCETSLGKGVECDASM
jgi:hypothetical protein